MGASTSVSLDRRPRCRRRRRSSRRPPRRPRPGARGCRRRRRSCVPRPSSRPHLPSRRGDRRCSPRRSGHRRRRPKPPHPGRPPPTEAAAIADLRPGAIPRPPQRGAVHGVPLRVARRERAPLTVRCRHVEDRVDNVAGVVPGRPAHSSLTGVGGNEIGDQLPLLVGQIAVRCSPPSAV